MFRTCAALVACMALAVGGCGEEEDASPAGSSAGSDRAGQRLTKQEWIERADAICLETEDAQQEIEDKAAEIRSRSFAGVRRKIAAVIEDRLAQTRDGFRRLKALKPPRADEAQVAEWIDAVDQMLGTYDDLIAALRKDDRKLWVKTPRETREIDGEQEVLADLLGLVDCRTAF